MRRQTRYSLTHLATLPIVACAGRVGRTVSLAARPLRGLSCGPAAERAGPSPNEFGIEEIPFGEHHWREAAEAYLRFGRGRHAARLSFGGCMTHAVARLANEPLLAVGNDFRQTDSDLA